MKLKYFSICIISTIGCLNYAFSAEDNSLDDNSNMIIAEEKKYNVIPNNNNYFLKNTEASDKHTDIKKIKLPAKVLHHIISYLDRDPDSLFTLMNFLLVNKNFHNALLSAPVYLNLTSLHRDPRLNITDKRVCRFVQLLPRTRSVTIDFGNITKEILTYLAPLSGLTTFHLKYTTVDDNALSLLKQFKNLTGLSFTKCKGISNLEFLEDITNLTSLDLLGITNASTPANLIFLGSLTQLKSLELSNLIWPLPIKSSEHKKAEIVANLDQNLIQLSHLTNLNRLNLARNPVKDNSLVLFSFLPNLTDLNLEGTQLTGTDLTFLNYLKKLRYLNLANIPVKDDVLSPLNGLASLTYLNLRKAEITDKGLKQITTLIDLTDLDLSAVLTIPSNALRMMYCFTNLTTLNLACCEQIVASDLMVFGNLKKLKWLNLYKIPKIRFEIRVKLKEQLPDLRIIYN